MMSRPVFLLQIVKAEAPHDVVRLHGGGPLERDLIALCTKAIVARGVGVFRTEKQVAKAIAEGLEAAILELKLDTRFVRPDA